MSRGSNTKECPFYRFSPRIFKQEHNPCTYTKPSEGGYYAGAVKQGASSPEYRVRHRLYLQKQRVALASMTDIARARKI